MEIETMAVNNLDHNTTHDFTSPLLCNFHFPPDHPDEALDFKLCSTTHPNPNSSPPSPQPMGLSLQKFGITSIEPNLDVDGVDEEEFSTSLVDREDGVDVERFGGSEYRADFAIVEQKVGLGDREDGVDMERFTGLENRVDSAIIEQKVASVDRQDGVNIERFVGSEYKGDSAIVANKDIEGTAAEEHDLKIASLGGQDGVDIEPFCGSENRADSAIFEKKIASVERFAGSENRANSAIVELKNASLDRQDGVDMEPFHRSEYKADSAIVANKDIEGTAEEELDLKITSPDRQDGIDIEHFGSSKYKENSAIVENEVVEGEAEEEHDLNITSTDRQDDIDIEPFTNSKYKVNSSIVENKDVERAADEEHELNTDFQDRLNTLFATVTNKVVQRGAEELNSTSPDQQNGINIEPFTGSEYKAAIKLQKFYKSYRTRRRLADSAIVAEELWWQARDFARLNHTTVSFFNYSKPETAISRWNRVSINASKVGQGLSKDGKALKLAFQHWIEAIDPRHRYGHNLHFYYEKWCESKTDQPFFYWLDLGEGKNLDLEECPRSLLRQQCIKYLGPHERERYEYVLVESRIRHKQTGDLLDTTKGPEGAKWIFVMSTSRRLYAGRKKRGRFQHSSFLAGGTTIAAGRLTAENGVLKAIWAYSGHYKPTTDNLKQFIDYLRENGADLNLVQIRASGKEDYNEDDVENPQSQTGKSLDTAASVLKPPPLRIPAVNFAPLDKPIESSVDNKSEVMGVVYRRTFSGGLQSPVAGVPEKAISERIKSKRESGSYQLGHQVSSKWCSGVGPRIGCIADYPVELRLQALEFTNLSPRTTQTPTHSFCSSSVLSPLSQVIS